MYYVYILSNWNNTVLYIGVTKDLTRRIYEHKSKLIPGFTSKYNVTKLLYFEEFHNINDAIAAEKKIKGWKKDKKIALVLTKNKSFKDLSTNLTTT